MTDVLVRGLPEEVHDAIRVVAAERGVSVNELLRSSLSALAERALVAGALSRALGGIL